jgi:hypothetical protein
MLVNRRARHTKPDCGGPTPSPSSGMRLLLPVILKCEAGQTHKARLRRANPLPVKRDETPATSDLEVRFACQTHDARLRRTDTPSPSKRNETPDTGDLEGRGCCSLERQALVSQIVR